MYLWVDDLREPPKDGNDWFWARSVSEAKTAIVLYERQRSKGAIHIDLDYDAGDYAFDGGDYIEVLKWLEREQLPDTGYTFHFHTMNPVGRDNMRTIINYNGWVESN
jgi:hypothetical protein